MHGDGIPGDDVWIGATNEARTPFEGSTGAWLSLTPMPITISKSKCRNVQQSPKCSQTCGRHQRSTLLCHIVTNRSLSTWHNSNASTLHGALAIHEVLDESCITAPNGRAGTGK